MTYQDDKDSTVKTVQVLTGQNVQLFKPLTSLMRHHWSLNVVTTQVPIGENLLEAAHQNDVDLEGAPMPLTGAQGLAAEWGTYS